MIDNGQFVKLYERVLRYVVLFGQEKEWNKQIDALYELVGQQDDWYPSDMLFTLRGGIQEWRWLVAFAVL
ncbi:MAG: hypothetical protein ACSLEY_01865 [Candidatus Saccharimonadales bacterium]